MPINDNLIITPKGLCFCSESSGVNICEARSNIYFRKLFSYT